MSRFGLLVCSLKLTHTSKYPLGCGSCGAGGLRAGLPKGPMWGYPRLVLGALGSFLEPFCGHVLPKVDKLYSKLTFEIPPRRALRGAKRMTDSSVGNRIARISVAKGRIDRYVGNRSFCWQSILLLAELAFCECMNALLWWQADAHPAP